VVVPATHQTKLRGPPDVAELFQVSESYFRYPLVIKWPIELEIDGLPIKHGDSNYGYVR